MPKGLYQWRHEQGRTAWQKSQICQKPTFLSRDELKFETKTVFLYLNTDRTTKWSLQMESVPHFLGVQVNLRRGARSYDALYKLQHNIPNANFGVKSGLCYEGSEGEDLPEKMRKTIRGKAALEIHVFASFI